MDAKQSHYGLHVECFKQVFVLDQLEEFQDLNQLQSQYSDISEGPDFNLSFNLSPYLSSYFSGNYRKYEARLASKSYIVKLSTSDYPELSAVEYLCQQIAEYCGLKVSQPYALLDFGEKNLAFVSKNFTHSLNTHTSLAHIYHFLPLGQSHYNVEKICEIIRDKTSSIQDVEQFVRVLLYDALVGNHDRHGRNLAFLLTAQSTRLAPIYDNPSALALESGTILEAHFSPRGKIWTQVSQESVMQDYLIDLERLGFMKNILDFYQSIDINQILKLIAHSKSISFLMARALKKLIAARYEDLRDYVKNQ